eukprot:3400256-Pleurochrysis_carterae.AAC.2
MWGLRCRESRAVRQPSRGCCPQVTSDEATNRQKLEKLEAENTRTKQLLQQQAGCGRTSTESERVEAKGGDRVYLMLKPLPASHAHTCTRTHARARARTRTRAHTHTRARARAYARARAHAQAHAHAHALAHAGSSPPPSLCALFPSGASAFQLAPCARGNQPHGGPAPRATRGGAQCTDDES